MKFAICQELFVDWDWERQCRFAAELGYTGMELAPFTVAKDIRDVSAETRRTMREQAQAAGVEIIGLHWLLAKTDGFHLTTADAGVRQATAEYLVELGNACADFGGDLMVFGSPPQRNLQPGVTPEQAFEHAVEVFRSCMPAIGERGVKICMEPLTSKETDFVNTCDQAMELIRAVDHPNFVLHQDVKAMLGAEEKSLPELIAEFAPYVGHFHVNDTNLLGPGMGETDYHPIFQALLDTGYDGWVSVEVFDYSPGCEKIARESMDYMQTVLHDLSA